MLFGSRSKTRSGLRMLREFFWPQKGFSRGWRYLAFRILRIKSSDYALASGFASGVLASLLPLIGVQFGIAAALAWVVRGNIIVSLLGTFVASPWGFPILLGATYATGVWLLGWEQVVPEVTGFDWGTLLGAPVAVLVAIIVGWLVIGLPVAVAVFVVIYFSAGKIRGAIVRMRGQRAGTRVRENT